ncbi:ABC transporter permease [Cohnella endophytica]|uniref:ABC transporter permease n=1 Tax=Cohnella endophytica TaxID=2419778 RepID=A0A494XIZ2_9BACL|nr:ABC transporter permease [Cohnella endophytica]RKP48044.1 ABC transporter permease [Cohnella endophytica]
MNILIIALKEIKTTLRDKRTFTFMLLFPIILMLILGTALSNAFSSTTPVGDLKLLYKSDIADKQLTQFWQSFSQAIEKEGIVSVPIEKGVDGKQEISANHYAAYAEVGDQGIAYYGSSKKTIESNILQGMLTAFADKYNLAAAAMATDPSLAEGIIRDANDSAAKYVKETSLIADKQPGSIDYYAMAMTTMIALYASISGTLLFWVEKKRNTIVRMIASPVSKGEIFAGKVIGCTVINILLVFAVMLVSKFVFQADWGNHLGIVLVVLVTEVMLAVSLGLVLSYWKGDSARSIVMIFTQISSFIGGAYFPLGNSGESFMGFISDLSPLRWANQALTKIIYNGDLGAAWPAIGLNVGIAAACLFIAVVSMRKKEAF